MLDREFILDHLKGFSVKKSEKPAKTLSTYGSVTHGTTKPTKIMMQLVLWICLYVTDLKCNQNTSSMFRKNMIPQVFINTNIYQYQILLIKYPKQFFAVRCRCRVRKECNLISVYNKNQNIS